MNTTIRKIGNSDGVIIPAAVMARLGMETGDPVTLDVEGSRLVISSRSGAASDSGDFERAAVAVTRRYASLLRKLADL